MTIKNLFHGPNAGYLYELYEQYTSDPESVDEKTREVFARWTPDGLNGSTTTAVTADAATVDVTKFAGAMNLARSIRRFGHRAATLDPLGSEPPGDPSLDPATHQLSEQDLASLPAALIGGPVGETANNAAEAVARLRQIYCGTTGYDYDHVQDATEREWLQQAIEAGQFAQPMSDDEKRELLQLLTNVEGYEKFIHKSFFGQKRFSIEGTDMTVPMIDMIVDNASDAGIPEVVIGMAHRGRLNTLAHILGKSYEVSIAQFAGKGSGGLKPASNDSWTGDVKYHMGWVREAGDGWQTKITMSANPSHLEFVNPVVGGMARAAQEKRDKAGPPEQNVDNCIPIILHGDSAFPGEGVVTESLNMSRIPGYQVGGSIHIIANNQIGYTTEPWQSRSTYYASDVARGFEIPIIHVNADDPVACMVATRIAYAYRQQFHKDFLIDLVGYRRWGHNEGDEPAFTQPQLYAIISKHPTVRQQWAETLDREGVLSLDDAKAMDKAFIDHLTEIRKKIDNDEITPNGHSASPVSANGRVHSDETAISLDQLKAFNKELHEMPEGFSLNPKLKRQIQRRVDATEKDGHFDWAHAEAIAFASIVSDGTPVRLEGQDTERGTFSQRHLVFHDVKNGDRVTPMQRLSDAKASFAVYNSPLTETAALGFDYGYSVHAPETMVLWEGQFGDFVNVGQVIIDQFITAGRAKWNDHPGLVLLLPHGYEGQGPEHSSARLERFLQLAADDNIRVANCTTSAQYFHLLRRQAASLTTEPRPLVVMTPKSLLRHPKAASALEEFTEGSFQKVIDDARFKRSAKNVTRLVLSSGKVHVDLTTSDSYEDAKNVALVRVEQLYPFPADEIKKVVKRYANLQDVVWLQEEPKNMGAWTYMQPRLQELLPDHLDVRYVGRPERASPAEGFADTHAAEQNRIIEEAFQDVKVPEETYGVKNAD